MATRVPVVGQTYTIGFKVVSVADTDNFQVNPTIAAGDFQISINGAAYENLDNLPTVTPAGGRRIQVVISAAETTAAGDGGEIDINGTDGAGDEWQSTGATLRVYAADVPTMATTMAADLVSILGTALTETAGQIAAAFKKFFDKAAPTGTVNSLPDAVAGASGGVAIVGSVMGKSPATLAAGDVTGNLPADVKAYTVQPTVTGATLAAGERTTLYAGIWSYATRTLTSLSALLQSIVDKVLDELISAHTDPGSVGEAIAAASGGGSGTSSLTVTVDDGASPIDGALVELTATSAHTGVIASGYTDALGKVTLLIDPGTYYCWVQHGRYNGTNPTTVVVA